MNDIGANLAAVRARIAAAARRYGRRPEDITLVAVSKAQPAAAIVAALEAGQRHFGENYPQEALEKMRALEAPKIVWHFIGRLQANKTRTVAERFAWVHSLDRARIAERLDAQRPASLPPLDVCLQVNVSGETTKGGVMPDALPELAAAVAALPRLRLRGLMALPAPAADFEAQRLPFRRLRALFDELRAHGFALDTLSMGMSADLEAAIAEGATLVRVGTAIFGARSDMPHPEA
ncbi:MAG TPA: YggS family pyridoxal phosphate-dependent enzyme [Gammaproteobacteria bacterium]|nr:YggS family pyridoxal phosphate-dependent enzyme [Gammaproteobacteria bacterium]